MSEMWSEIKRSMGRKDSSVSRVLAVHVANPDLISGTTNVVHSCHSPKHRVKSKPLTMSGVVPQIIYFVASILPFTIPCNSPDDPEVGISPHMLNEQKLVHS